MASDCGDDPAPRSAAGALYSAPPFLPFRPPDPGPIFTPLQEAILKGVAREVHIRDPHTEAGLLAMGFQLPGVCLGSWAHDYFTGL